MEGDGMAWVGGARDRDWCTNRGFSLTSTLVTILRNYDLFSHCIFVSLEVEN
jgi:hypothetical protein